MNRSAALEIVQKYVKNQNLINHMLCVEAAMAFYAEQLHQDVDTWRIAGLLHDFDWEKHPTADLHPSAGEPILREQGVPEEIIRAVQSHARHTGIQRITLMEKALFACDEVTGLITAVALVRPSRSLYDLTSSSVKKKWKDKGFAAGVDRSVIEKGSAMLGIELPELIGESILGLRTIAAELDLAGNPGRN